MKILLVQTSFLGDIVLSTPLISAIQLVHPGCELHVLTTSAGAELLKRNAAISTIHIFEKRTRHRGIKGLWQFSRELKALGFDRVYSLHRSARTAMVLYLSGIRERIGFAEAKLTWLYTSLKSRRAKAHDVERNLAILGKPAQLQNFVPELDLVAPDSSELGEAIKRIVDKLTNFVVLVPGSAWATKRWAWRGYRAVAEYYIAQKRPVVIIGEAGEVSYNRQVSADLNVIDLSGQTSLTDVLWIISKAGLVICNDSFALHVSSAFKVPNVAVFCATSPAFGFGPWRNRSAIVEKTGLYCKPCRRHGSKSCPTGTNLCMTGVKPAEVIFEAERLVPKQASL